MSTPEGVSKDLLKKILNDHDIFPASKAIAFPERAQGWYFMPVPVGYGTSGIHDVVGHYRGAFFSIEVKAPGRRGQVNRGCSAHQHHQSVALESTGAFTMVFDGGDDDVKRLTTWLKGA